MTHTHTHTQRGVHSGVGHGWRGLAGSQVSIQFSDENSKKNFSNSYYSKELSIVFAILTSKYFQHIIWNFLFYISIVSLSRRFNVWLTWKNMKAYLLLCSDLDVQCFFQFTAAMFLFLVLNIFEIA